MSDYDIVLTPPSVISWKTSVLAPRVAKAIQPITMNRAMSVATSAIRGLVTIQGRPVARPVMVLKQSGELIEHTMSNAAGEYEVAVLDRQQRYIVLSLDVPERKYNAAISDYVQPELL